jgi:hypothetical protein
MPFFTLGQAAKATGRSKSGILDAIRGGRLSATRDDKNQWQIDPVELHRVYPLLVQPSVKSEQDQTPLNANGLIHFEEKIGFLERIIGNLESERDDLRRRLDKEAEERREAQTKLAALLTYQPESKADTPPALPKARAAVRQWLWVALAVASVAAAIAQWLVYRG